MIEKHLHDPEDVEELIGWMQDPPNRKRTLKFDAPVYLARLQLTDTWLRSYMSKGKVVRMLLAHHKALGLPYSESTALRDVNAAQRVFETLSSHKRKYWTDIMLDLLAEQMDSAKRAHKHDAVARLSGRFLEWIKYADECELQDRSVTKLIPVVGDYAPQLAGIDRNPNALEETIQLLIGRGLMKEGSVTEGVIIAENGDEHRRDP